MFEKAFPAGKVNSWVSVSSGAGTLQGCWQQGAGECGGMRSGLLNLNTTKGLVIFLSLPLANFGGVNGLWSAAQ